MVSIVPAFADYDEAIRRALARVVGYEVVEGVGRVVVRQVRNLGDSFGRFFGLSFAFWLFFFFD